MEHHPSSNQRPGIRDAEMVHDEKGQIIRCGSNNSGSGKFEVGNNRFFHLRTYSTGRVNVVRNNAESSPCVMQLKISGKKRRKFVVSRIRLKIQTIASPKSITGLITIIKSKNEKQPRTNSESSGSGAPAGSRRALKNAIPTTNEITKQKLL